MTKVRLGFLQMFLQANIAYIIDLVLWLYPFRCSKVQGLTTCNFNVLYRLILIFNTLTLKPRTSERLHLVYTVFMASTGFRFLIFNAGKTEETKVMKKTTMGPAVTETKDSRGYSLLGIP